MSPHKHSDTQRIGGPGASHENRRAPRKSAPHGELNTKEVRSGNAATREQNRPWHDAQPVETQVFASRTDAGASSAPQRAAPARGRGVSRKGHTAKKDPTVKPKERRQVR